MFGLDLREGHRAKRVLLAEDAQLGQAPLACSPPTAPSLRLLSGRTFLDWQDLQRVSYHAIALGPQVGAKEMLHASSTPQCSRARRHLSATPPLKTRRRSAAVPMSPLWIAVELHIVHDTPASPRAGEDSRDRSRDCSRDRESDRAKRAVSRAASGYRGGGQRGRDPA